MPLPPDTTCERLRVVRAEWLETLRELCAAANRQHEAITSPDGDEALRAILAAKEGLYRRAEELSRQALALEAAGAEPDADGAALKPLLFAAQRELADAEVRAREELALRIADLRSQLDGLQWGRAAHGVYSAHHARGAAPAPRFLDQSR